MVTDTVTLGRTDLEIVFSVVSHMVPALRRRPHDRKLQLDFFEFYGPWLWAGLHRMNPA